MKKHNTQYTTGLSVSIVGLVLLAVHTWGTSQFLIGTTGLLFTYIGMTILMTALLHTIFRIHPKKMSTWILSAGASILGSFILVGIPIIFTTLTGPILYGSMLSAVMIVVVLNGIAVVLPERYKKIPHPYSTPEIGSQLLVSKHYLWPVLYGAIWIFGMILAFSTVGTEAITTPWQTLPSLYTFSVFMGGLILVALLLSRSKTSIILAIIVLQSVLMHVYIPASHELPAGGDIWRHIGRVEHVLAGQPIRPILFGTDIATTEVFGMTIPAVFVQSQQYAYNMLWGAHAMIHTYTGISLEQIGRWLVPILWSVLTPIIFFFIGYLLFDSRRKGLILSALLLVPFSLQAVGSLTLPVSLGYLVFLYGFLWLLFAMRGGTTASWFIVWKHALLLLFVYPVHAIVFMALATITAISRRFLNQSKIKQYRIFLICSLFAGVCLIPGIELLAGTSFVSTTFSFIDSAKRIGGELSGWYIASQIRPHDILSGNIIMNHTPDWAFVSSVFSNFRWHILLFQIVALALALYGMIRAFLQKRNFRWHMMLVFNAIVMGGYIIGWYFLDGDRQLVRRMDVFLGIGLLTFAWYGFLQFLEIIEEQGNRQVKTTVFSLCALATVWVGMTTFLSGPDMRTVSAAEYHSAAYISETYPDTTCVLADTYTLLALESKTASSIIGGGFPIDLQYGQGERLALYNDLLAGQEEHVVDRLVGHVPSSLSCIIVVPLDQTNVPIEAYQAIFDAPTVLRGNTAIWHIQLQKSVNSITIDAIH